MSPIQCRLNSLNLPKEKLDRWGLFSIHNSDEINFKIYKEDKSIKDVIPKKKYCLKDEFVQRFGHFFEKTYVEIACGTGDFICAMAEKNPVVNFIGVDYALPVIERAVIKAEEKHLNNLLFYIGRAEDFFAYDMTNEMFDFVMVNFPDPWLKKKHHKRRIVQANLLDAITKLLKKDGGIITVTDVIELYDWHCEILAENKVLKEKESGDLPSFLVDAYSVKSIYEKKGRLSNRNIHYTFHKCVHY